MAMSRAFFEAFHPFSGLFELVVHGRGALVHLDGPYTERVPELWRPFGCGGGLQSPGATGSTGGDTWTWRRGAWHVRLDPSCIDDALLKSHLLTGDIPDPDARCADLASKPALKRSMRRLERAELGSFFASKLRMS